MWMDVKYEPGTLKVVAFDKQGDKAAEKEIHTAGEPYQIILQPEVSVIKANGEDLPRFMVLTY